MGTHAQQTCHPISKTCKQSTPYLCQALPWLRAAVHVSLWATHLFTLRRSKVARKGAQAVSRASLSEACRFWLARMPSVQLGSAGSGNGRHAEHEQCTSIHDIVYRRGSYMSTIQDVTCPVRMPFRSIPQLLGSAALSR